MDLWAEPGTTWGQVIGQLMPEAAEHRWFVGATPVGDDQVIGQAPVLPGCELATTPQPDQRPAPGNWRLVALGGPIAGLAIRPWSGSVDRNLTGTRQTPAQFALAKAGLRLRRRTPGPLWTGQVVGRRGRLKVRWRRLGRRARVTRRGTLIRTGSQTWVLDRPLGAQPELTNQATPPRRLVALLTPVVVAVAMGGVMWALTRNLMWAAMPLAGALSALATSLVRRGGERPNWVDQVQGLAGTSLVAPSDHFDLHGPKAAALAASRAWAAGLAGLSTPTEPDWAWARFCQGQARAPNQVTVIAQTDSHLTWRAGQGEGQPSYVVVKPAGLGLLAVRVDGAPPFLMVGWSQRVALQRSRAMAARQPPPAAPNLAIPVEYHQLRDRWALDQPVFPVGRLPGGDQLDLDLVQSGPHMVVAGATGSGKSEFLRTVILGAAAAMSPSRLAIVGIDHKGGASFADLSGLPHLAGVVTDLDPVASSRTLASLEAELRRRERLIQQHGQAKLTDLPVDVRPPRLMVVVDEFRTLLDGVPTAGAALERLAAQGRSLEMFLVLATQRPAGAVSAQLRANLPLRVCFRVATETDSIDMLGDTSAMKLDPGAPGSAVMASAGREPTRFQAALVGDGGPRPPKVVTWPDNWEAPPAPTSTGANSVVAALAAAAKRSGQPKVEAPWAPPLPAAVGLAELADWPPALASEPSSRGGVAVGLADLPDEQRLGALVVSPDHGHLAVLGAPRSGRTTSALTVAAAALAAGWPTHVVTKEPAIFGPLRQSAWLGTLVEPTAGDLVAWFESVQSETSPGPKVVVIDNAEPLAELILPNQDRPVLDLLVGLGPDWWVVITASARPGRYLTHFPQRLILPTMDPADDLALGLVRQLAGGRSRPGQVVYSRPGINCSAQVALVDQPTWQSFDWTPPPLRPPPRVVPIPSRVDSTDLPPPSPDRLWWGLGGRLGLPVALDLAPGQLIAVVGPPGSGRSSVLTALAGQARAAGLEVYADLPGDPWPGIAQALSRGAFVVLDNLEQVPNGPGVLPRQGQMIAALTATPSPAFHGPASLFQGASQALVLWPRGPGAGAAVGLSLPSALATQRLPGRGVAARAGRITSVQAVTG